MATVCDAISFEGVRFQNENLGIFVKRSNNPSTDNSEDQSPRILIVDDTPDNIRVLGTILKQEGYNIRVATNGVEALETVTKVSPDLILLDVMMPRMDGFETCLNLKKNPETQNIPILFVSAKGEVEDITTGFEVGGVDYITKPYKSVEIIARIKTHLALREQRKHLEYQNFRLRDALKVSEISKRKIVDSMRYAKTIQRSLLPRTDEFRKQLPESFVIWEPRDIVGGDFYFMNFFENGFIIAVIDCTGHGVPGALMTMLAYSGLKKLIKDDSDNNPAKILKMLNAIIKTSLSQDKDSSLSDDGLDAGICYVRPQERLLAFAGAKLSLYYSYKNEIRIIKGDRQSIGYRRSKLDFTFRNHIVPIENGIKFYMLTDGFTDQIGGQNLRMFGKKRFRKLLAKIADRPMSYQREVLLTVFNEYRGKNECTDDVTVVGFAL